MKKTLLSLVISALTLSACSSAPTPVIPDGNERTPINTAAKIEDYKISNAEIAANQAERTALSRQIEGLKGQVSELKAYMVMLQMGLEANTPKPRPAPQINVIGNGSESIEYRDQGIVFRVMHPFGKTKFQPSAVLEEKLLAAARDSKRIEIRGRTDAAYDNSYDKKIAMQRALLARKYLVSKGIDPSKIRWSYLASGGYVADNTTTEGRAFNRRVEIEAMDLETTPTTSKSKTVVGSSQ